jgi:hypothetical protein
MTDSTVTTPDAAAPDAPGSRHRGRAVTAMVLIVIASILLPLAGLTVWVRNMMLNTDRYVTTVSPLPSDPAVQEAIATKLSVALVRELDIQDRAKSALPEKAQFLAAPIATGATQLAHNATLKLVSTEKFQQLWDAANRRAHDQIVAALTGEGTKHIKNSNG